MMPGLGEAELPSGIAMITGRMIPRLSFVGYISQTKDLIDWSNQLAILDRHLAARQYLFGGRPQFRRLRSLRPALSVDQIHAGGPRPRGAHMVKWIQAMLGPRTEDSSRAGRRWHRR